MLQNSSTGHTLWVVLSTRAPGWVGWSPLWLDMSHPPTHQPTEILMHCRPTLAAVQRKATQFETVDDLLYPAKWSKEMRPVGVEAHHFETTKFFSVLGVIFELPVSF